MALITLTPVDHFSLDVLNFSTEKWKVHLDSVTIYACTKEWDSDDIVVFRADKTNKSHLMIPEAHFYGPVAYGFVIRQKKRLHTVSDSHTTFVDRRNVCFILCQPNGCMLPQMSTELCPSQTHVIYRVNKAAYDEGEVNAWVHLTPDFDSFDMDTTPNQMWTHALCPAQDNNAGLHIVGKLRNKTLNDQTPKIKYGFIGYTLQQKCIETPLSRHVGKHLPIDMTETPRQHGVKPKLLKITMRRRVKKNEDFLIGAQHLRIKNTTGKGGCFYAHELDD
jgi:hypothetical protein